MKTYLQCIILIIWCFSSNAQKPHFNLEKPSYDSVFKIEKSNGGQIKTYSYSISVSKDYFPNAANYHLANPLVFIRKNKDFYLNVSYYYSLDDSIVRLIEYSWDLKSSKTKILYKLFNRNKRTISEYFKNQGLETKRIKNDENDWDGSTIIWEDDKRYVKLFLINGQRTYRVRVLISWK